MKELCYSCTCLCSYSLQHAFKFEDSPSFSMTVFELENKENRKLFYEIPLPIEQFIKNHILLASSLLLQLLST